MSEDEDRSTESRGVKRTSDGVMTYDRVNSETVREPAPVYRVETYVPLSQAFHRNIYYVAGERLNAFIEEFTARSADFIADVRPLSYDAAKDEIETFYAEPSDGECGTVTGETVPLPDWLHGARGPTVEDFIESLDIPVENP